MKSPINLSDKVADAADNHPVNCGTTGPFTAGAIAEDYLELCRNPFKDWQRWAAESEKAG